MAFEPKQIVEQARAVWQKQSPSRKAVLVAALLAVPLAIFLIARGTGQPKYATLFAGLAPEDAGSLVEDLKAQKVPYKLEAGGTAITVPEDKVHEVRLDMAARGLPKGGGVGFEIFDKQSFGASSFVEQMNYRRALQGELQRTIGTLTAVERVRVHVALGERSLYKKDDEPPSASVVLALRPGRDLSRAQVKGIVHLVASSVEGLAPEHVTVVDERGQVLSALEDEEDAAFGGQRDLEKALARRIQEILERVVGPGHVAVSVTADMDQTAFEKTEEIYQQDKDNFAVRSESRVLEGADALANGAGGVAGVRGNLPGAPAPAVTPPGAAGTPGNGRVQETRNYEVNRTVNRTVAPKARLRRLHVAVVVDGKPGEDGELIERTKDELKTIEALAREAGGLDGERGDKLEVRSVIFAGAPEPEVPVAAPKGLPRLFIPIAAGAGALLLAIIAFVVLRRRKKAAAAKDAVAVLPSLPARVADVEHALPGPDGQPAPAAAALGDGQKNPRDRVLEAVAADGERAALVLSAWLAEPLPQGGK